MRIKSRYYEQGVFPQLQKDINTALMPFPDFREELFDKLFTFFQRYFSESGSIYFRYTALHQNVYEKVYTDDRDVILFWKTHMLYYVKTDRIFTSLNAEVDGVKFFFDASKMTLKKSNEKREVVYAFRKVQPEDGTLVFDVAYSEKGKTTKVDDILKDIKKANVKLDDETLNQAFRVFEKQSEVDFFINKDARAFLQEQFDLWLYQYLFAGQNVWSTERLAQLQALKAIAYKVIDFISQFEDELVKIWNKPKFVRNSHYVLTLDKLGSSPVLEKLLAHPNLPQQVQEWRDLDMIGEDFKLEMLTQRDLTGGLLHPQYQYLPIDTKYFPDLELDVLALFDDLDAALDGWLVHSENYQALNSMKAKFQNKLQTIYIDPPYNAETSEIYYENTYKHSSFASLLDDRIHISKNFLREDFVYYIAIDEVEQNLLGYINRNNFPDNKSVCVTVIHNRRGQQGKNFSSVHEYVFVVFPNDKNKYIGDRVFDNIDHRILRDSGTESMRTDAKNCFYPIQVKNGSIISFGDVPEDTFHPTGVNELQEDGSILVWPIDTSKNERKWRYARQSIEEIANTLEVVEVRGTKKKEGSFQIYLNKETGTQKTVWDSELFDASEYGTKTLQDLFTESITTKFKYPKSLYLVIECLKSSLPAKKNGMILDYFAGSGTTAHAVMNLNRADGGKRKYILVEMGEYFDTIILPRIKKVAFSDKWKDGKPNSSAGMSHFVKYYDLEQYEDVLRSAHYADADLFHNPYEDPYHSYVFLRDLKMLDSVEIDEEQNKAHFYPERLYPDIDLAETLSQRRGKWIKRITAEYVEFQDGERMSLTDPDWQTIKPLVWWQ
jgi:adenine-specific DNA-methyltransferase